MIIRIESAAGDRHSRSHRAVRRWKRRRRGSNENSASKSAVPWTPVSSWGPAGAAGIVNRQPNSPPAPVVPLQSVTELFQLTEYGAKGTSPLPEAVPVDPTVPLVPESSSDWRGYCEGACADPAARIRCWLPSFQKSRSGPRNRTRTTPSWTWSATRGKARDRNAIEHERHQRGGDREPATLDRYRCAHRASPRG